jgi:hypothetical protein
VVTITIPSLLINARCDVALETVGPWLSSAKLSCTSSWLPSAEKRRFDSVESNFSHHPNAIEWCWRGRWILVVLCWRWGWVKALLKLSRFDTFVHVYDNPHIRPTSVTSTTCIKRPQYSLHTHEIPTHIHGDKHVLGLQYAGAIVPFLLVFLIVTMGWNCVSVELGR